MESLPPVWPRVAAAAVRRRPAGRADLRTHLDALARQYDQRLLASDPLEFPRRSAGPRDREVVALLAAVLSTGIAEAIKRNVAHTLELIGPAPHRCVLGFEPSHAGATR